MMHRISLLFICLLLLATQALAQSTPQFSYGGALFGRTDAQWNAYFGAKVDVENGTLDNPTFTNVNISNIFPNASPNTIFAGPSSGPSGKPSFRAMVGADLPAPTTSTLGGVKALSAVAKLYLDGIDPAGSPLTRQPLCQDASNPNCAVADTSALSTAARADYPIGVWRLTSASNSTAPPMYFTSQTGLCATHNYPNSTVLMVSDGASCENSSDGNSFVGQFSNGIIDVRQFGAKPDNSTPMDTALAAARAYAGVVNGCVTIPQVGTFVMSNPLVVGVTGSNCVIGQRSSLQPLDTSNEFDALPTIRFPSDTDGITVGPLANQGYVVRDLAIVGSAATSAVSTHTIGLFVNKSYDGQISNIRVENFVVCREYDAPSGRTPFDHIFCHDKYSYPNGINDYPYACLLLASGDGSAVVGNGVSDIGSLCEGQSVQNNETYTGDGSQKNFQICAPGATTASGTFTRTCGASPNQPNAWLWDTFGIKVRIGAAQIISGNGFAIENAPLLKCGYSGQVASYDYDIYDISQTGGGGSGGLHLFCTETTGTTTAGQTYISVPDVTAYQTGNNILVWGDHGVPAAAKLVSKSTSPCTGFGSGACITISKAATQSDTVSLIISQIGVATAGPSGWSKACQTTPGQNGNVGTCGVQIEVRTVAAPASSARVRVEWYDPTIYTAYDGEAVGDGLVLRPNFIGGVRDAVKLVSAAYSTVDFLSNYIEIVDRLVSQEGTTGISRYVIKHLVNPWFYDAPGYVDSNSGPTTIKLNEKSYYYNGAGP